MKRVGKNVIKREKRLHLRGRKERGHFSGILSMYGDCGEGFKRVELPRSFVEELSVRLRKEGATPVITEKDEY